MWQSFMEDYGPESFMSFNMSELEVDEAYVQFSSSFDYPVNIYHKSSQCYRCPYRKALTLQEGENATLKYNTYSYWSFLASDSTQEFIKHPVNRDTEDCFAEEVSIGEFGVYEFNANPAYCDIKVLKDPVFEYGAIIFALVFYVCLGLLWISGKYIYSRCIPSEKKKEDQKDLRILNGTYSPPHTIIPNGHLSSFPIRQREQPASKKKVRLLALDIFRGITIALMILVNYGAGKYWFLEHAPWNGLTIADFVFPWFMWIMGVCIPMGMKSQLKKEIPKSKIFWRILKRSLKLFAIGLILNTVGGNNQLESIRIPGVLQRFAISYFVTSSVYLLCNASDEKNPISGVFKSIGDIIILFPQWVLYILLIIGHTIFIFYMPNPGCPSGYLGPGGIVLLQNGQPSPNCIGGITRMVDIWILGENHMYQYPTAKSIYETSSFDPEGILGSVPTLLQVFLGIQAGQILLTFEDPKSRLRRWTIWSFGTLVVSLTLSSGIIIGGPIPVNKNLWSLSYVFITSSAAFLLLSVCYFLADFVKVWKGSPFYQAGMNSIFLYIGHYVAYNVFPWRYRYGKMNTHMALFPEALFGTTLWILIAIYLHKKNKFYTV